jgi:Fe-S cluster assembly protein SufD
MADTGTNTGTDTGTNTTRRGAPGGADALVRPYLDDFARFSAARPGGEPASTARLRRAAIDAFAAQGFPTVRQEDWRFTNVAPLAQRTFARAEGPVDGASADGDLPDVVRPYIVAGAHDLVFVDGRFAPALSSSAALGAGVVAGSLGDALAGGDGSIAAWLGRHVRFDRQPFVALNTAFLADGAFVRVPRGVVLETPLHLVFIGTAGPAPRVAYPRNLVVVGENAQATVVETYVGTGTYFTCAATEIALGAGSVVDHYKVQAESLAASHLATLQVIQDRDSTFATHSISTGGGLVRYDVNAFLDGAGVDCTLNGLYVASGTQLVDHHMWVEHAGPHGNSRELFKGILDDHARAVFSGRIHVHRGAQKTDAKQANRNLLLSDQALVNSNPQLEIFADDVKCTHGSTVGQLDAEALFYLRSRGIGEAAARSLLVYAFAGEVVGGIKLDAVRTNLENHLYFRLPHGDIVRQAV